MALSISQKESKYYKMTCPFDGCDKIVSMVDLGLHFKIHVMNIIKEINDAQN